MEALTPEKQDGNNGEKFVIRIFDWHDHFKVKIYLDFMDDGEEREWNIKSYELPKETPKEELYAHAKKSILLIDLLRGLSEKQDADILFDKNKDGESAKKS